MKYFKMSISNSNPNFPLCTFCYKPAVSSKNNNIVVQKFIKFMGRLSGGEIDLPSLISITDSCQDCVNLIDKFCQVYHQIKCLELQLAWKLDTLVRVMKLADKVPSRVTMVKKYFERKTGNQDDDDVGKSRLDIFKSFRQEMLQKCSHGVTSTQPQLFIKRIKLSSEGTIDPQLESQLHMDMKPIASHMPMISSALGWLMSFAATVLLVSFPYNEEPNFEVDLGGSDNNIMYIDEVDSNEQFEATADDDAFMKDRNQYQGHENETEVNTFIVVVKQNDAATNDPKTCAANSEVGDTHERMSMDDNESVAHSDLENNEFMEGAADMNLFSVQEIETETNNTNCVSVQQTTNAIEIETDEPSIPTSVTVEPQASSEIQHKNSSSHNNTLTIGKKKRGRPTWPNHCSFCKRAFAHENSFKSHSKICQHIFHQRKKINENDKLFRCGICKTSYLTYKKLLGHKMRATHKILQKMLLTKVNKARVKIEGIKPESSVYGHESHAFVDAYADTDDSSSNTSSDYSINEHTNRNLKRNRESAQLGRDVINEEDKTRCRYNLRGKPKISYADQEGDEDIGNVKGNVISSSTVDDNYTTASSSDAEEDDEGSSSSHDEEDSDNLEQSSSPAAASKKRGRPRKGRNHAYLNYYHCKTDGCKRVFFKKHLFDEHGQLHKRGSYPCSFCEVMEDTVLKLSEHEANNHPNNPNNEAVVKGMYSCSRCRYSSRLAGEYHKHFAALHVGGFKFSKIVKTRTYRCILDECKFKPIIFKKWEVLEEHKKLHERGSYPCHFCAKVEVNIIKLSLHESKIHSTKADHVGSHNKYTWHCARCPFECKWERFYVRHFASEHMGRVKSNVGKEFVVCDICKRKLKKESGDMHFKTHHDTTGSDPPRIFNCDVDECSAYFLQNSQLYLHKRTQHALIHNTVGESDEDDYHPEEIKNQEGKIYFQCNICSSKFLLFKYLRTHKRRYHRRQVVKAEIPYFSFRKPFVCPVVQCIKAFRTKKGFEVHKRLHGTFSCKFCDVIKEYAPDLASHESNEHGTRKAKKFECPRCSLGFSEANIFTEHFLSKHLDLSTLCSTCPICKYESPNETLRNHHSAFHDTSGLQPSQVPKCDQCPAYFRKLGQLIRHKNRMHKCHSCTECSRSFTSNGQLISHMNHVHPYHNENPKNPFPCDVAQCNKRFGSQSELNNHKRYHHNRSSVETKCLKCDRVFRSQQGLIHHTKAAHSAVKTGENVKKNELQIQQDDKREKPQALFRCGTDGCRMQFVKKSTLEEHQMLHRVGRFPCKYCDLVLNNILKLCMHESSKHPIKSDVPNRDEGIIYCSRCPFQSKIVSKFYNHFSAMHIGGGGTGEADSNIDERFNCGICGEEINSGRELALHEAKHYADKSNVRSPSSDNATGTKPYNCSRCQLDFQLERVYLRHFMIKHLGTRCGRQETCPICQVKTVRYDTHYRTSHNIDGLDPSQIYKCEECPAYFITINKLKRHETRIHNKDCKCAKCGKLFKTRQSLRSHMRQYHPHPCDVPHCKKVFASQANMELHKRVFVHNDTNTNDSKKKRNDESCEKLKCPECNKEFSNKLRLKLHTKCVHGDCCFICAECGKGFTTKLYLKTHMKYHKGPDSWKFQCASCGKKCIDKPRLQQHMRTHTKEKRWICKYCGEKYAHQHNWKNHVLTKHHDEEDLPEIRKIASSNRVSRKGSKKGDCITAGVSQAFAS